MLDHSGGELIDPERVQNQYIDLQLVASLTEEILFNLGNAAWKNCLKTLCRLENDNLALKKQLDQQM